MIAAASGRVAASAPAIMWRMMPIRRRSPPRWRRADGTAAELERGGPVADEKRDPGRPDEVAGALIAERGAELAAFAQAGAGLVGVGLGDGRAHLEQGGRDQGRGADLAGQRERFVRQRDRSGRVTGEQVTGHGEGELDGGVGEVAAGPRETSGLFGEAGGVGERAGSNRDVCAGGADGLLDPPVRGDPGARWRRPPGGTAPRRRSHPRDWRRTRR